MFHQVVLDELLEEKVEGSRGKRNKRGVKRKMSGFPIRRRGKAERLWTEPGEAVMILNQQDCG